MIKKDEGLTRIFRTTTGKRILNLGIFLVLLFGMAIFPSIPIAIFNIPYETFSIQMQALYRFICDVIFILIVFYIYKDKIIHDFKNYFKNFRDNFETSFKYYFIGVVLMVVTNLIITMCFSGAIAGNEDAVREMIGDAPLYMLFSVSIYAPFIEEMLFRFCIKKCFLVERKTKLVRYSFSFISGFIFAALHILGHVNSLIDYIYIIPYMSLGITFSMLYYDTDNIFSSIMMHSFHNTAAIILYFVSGGIV